MTKQPSDLLPCPFCGGPAELEEVDGGGWSVGCEEKALSVHYCMGYQSLTSFATKREAIAAWNTRTLPPPAETGDVLEVLEDCRKYLTEFGSVEPSQLVRRINATVTQLRRDRDEACYRAQLETVNAARVREGKEPLTYTQFLSGCGDE